MFINAERVRIYLASFLYSFHYALVLYINSSFLGNYFDAGTVSLLFICGAFGSIVLFTHAPMIIDRFGTKRVLIYSLILDFLAILGLLTAKNPPALALAFILYTSVILLMPLCFDIYLEAHTRESLTGRVRGTNLTLSNLGILLAPIILALIVVGSNFSIVYVLSALVLVPLTFIALSFKNLHSAFHGKNHSFEILMRIWLRHKDVRRVTLVRLGLETFYSVMVIYTPLYLFHVIGFSWHTIGGIFAVMLLPFVLFEQAIGWLVDRVYGEREIMTIGLCIMAVTLILLLNLEACVAAWAIVLFLSRVGASMIEVTTESYFFKNVGPDDAGLISIFRLTRSTSIILGALIGGVVVSLYSYQALFALLAGVIFLTTIFSTKIRDTR
jgi:MFS family permease